MYRLNCNVVIGQYRLAGVVAIEIECSWELLTDTCKITLPATIWHAGKFTDLAASQLIKRGDPVQIDFGYDDALNQEFSGYVVRVNSGSPVVIECEDAFFLMKKGNITKTYRQVKLSQLVSDISNIPKIIADVDLGQFRISNATPAQVLDEIKKTYGLVSFIRTGKLFVGLPYPNTGKTHRFAYGINIIEENSELTYRRADEISIKVKAISIMPDNSKHEIEIGDPDGEIRTLNFYNVPKNDLKKLAEQESVKLRSDGFEGSFETFGMVSVSHGDLVSIEDPRSSVKGSYFVKAVSKSFSAQGIRQKIQIDRKV